LLFICGCCDNDVLEKGVKTPLEDDDERDSRLSTNELVYAHHITST